MLKDKLVKMVIDAAAILAANPDLKQVQYEFTDIPLAELAEAAAEHGGRYYYSDTMKRMVAQFTFYPWPGIVCFCYSAPVAIETRVVESVGLPDFINEVMDYVIPKGGTNGR